MNGAPEKPINGTGPSSAMSIGPLGADSTAAGSRAGTSTSPGVRIGCATTGPVPATMSRSTPAALNGRTMSQNKIAASTP